MLSTAWPNPHKTHFARIKSGQKKKEKENNAICKNARSQNINGMNDK